MLAQDFEVRDARHGMLAVDSAGPFPLGASSPVHQSDGLRTRESRDMKHPRIEPPPPPRRRPTPRRWSSTVLVPLPLLCLLACGGEGPLRFAVLFQDAQGIERGDDVEYKGLEIGEVTRVAVDEEGNVRIEVEVRPRHRGALSMGSLIDVERAGVLGGRKLVVRDGEGARIPMLEGAELIGRESEGDRAVDSLRRAGKSAIEGVSALGEGLTERLRALRESDEAKELADSLTRFGEEAATMTREQAERFREERLPALRERAEELRRELEEQGLEEDAKGMWEDFERWLEEVRNQGS